MNNIVYKIILEVLTEAGEFQSNLNSSIERKRNIDKINSLI